MATVLTLHPEHGEVLRQIFLNAEAYWPAHLSTASFFQEVHTQGMAPVLFRSIMERDASYWPAELLSSLKETALRQAAAELHIEAELRNLLKAFAQAGIQPLVLKGTALAYSIYPEPWLRPRCDTDLLVTEAERDKAEALLRHVGYAPLLAAHTEYLGTQKSYSRVSQGLRYTYDLHWQISNTNRQFSHQFADAQFFADVISVPSLGDHARSLSRVDSLIYACFHRAGHFSHSGDRLVWLYDIHLLCQALTAQEATRFYSKAKQLEISTLCADALAVTAFWFNTDMPAQLATLMQETPRNEAFTVLLKPGGRQVGIKEHALLELQGLPTERERLRFLWQKAFPPPEFMLWRYKAAKRSALPWLYVRRLAEALFIFLKR